MSLDSWKDKWCPMMGTSVSAHDTVAAVFKSPDGNQVKLTCVGSNCMMWREGALINETECTGYCGLAGNP